MKMKLAIALFLICQGMLANKVFAERIVYINGQRISPQELQVLDAMACVYIQNGSYWVLDDGTWGYVGSFYSQGHISDNCYRPQGSYNYRSNGTRKSLSERQSLYSPGELLR